MSYITLIHPEERRQLPFFEMITKCNLFKNNLSLGAAPYAVQSSVSLAIFRDFVSVLEGNDIEITEVNHSGLSLLAEEFDCADLSVKLAAFVPSSNFKDTETQSRISALEEWRKHHEREFEAHVRDFTEKLRGADLTKFSRVEASLLQLSKDVTSLRSVWQQAIHFFFRKLLSIVAIQPFNLRKNLDVDDRDQTYVSVFLIAGQKCDGCSIL
jgi:hypothetical protein